MISLYPSHIYISFPYSHILPYPYISHIHVSIFLSAPPVALPLVFFHFFIFMAWGRGVFFLWFFGVGVVDVFQPVPRPASRFVLRFVPPLVPFFVQPFGQFLTFRSSTRLSARPIVSFFRFGVSGGRFVCRAVFVSSSWLFVRR